MSHLVDKKSGTDPAWDAYVDAYFDAETERWLEEESDRLTGWVTESK